MRGRKLSPEQAAQAEKIILVRMRLGSFTYGDLHRSADRVLGLGAVGEPSTYRLADRLIQRERKAGTIRQTAKRGEWVPVEPA